MRTTALAPVTGAAPGGGTAWSANAQDPGHPGHRVLVFGERCPGHGHLLGRQAPLDFRQGAEDVELKPAGRLYPGGCVDPGRAIRSSLARRISLTRRSLTERLEAAARTPPTTSQLRTFNEHGCKSSQRVFAARTLYGMHEFVGSVGPSEIHDATIERVDAELDRLVVTLRCGNASRAQLRIELSDPVAVEQKRAVGMTLYSLAELRGAGERRRFSFVNWDEDDDARLEVEASAISWSLG